MIAFAAAPDTPTEPAVTTPNDARSSVGLDVSPDVERTLGVARLLGRTLAIAALIPARRAVRVDPVTVWRAD